MPVSKKDTDRRGRVEKPITAQDKFRAAFSKIGKPDAEPKMPKQMSVITLEQLSDLQNVYARWREFTEDLLVEALVDFTNQKNNYDFEYDKLFLNIAGKTKAEKEARINTDLRIHNLFLNLSQAETFHTLLSSKLESYNNCLTVISRDLTRRTNTP